MNRAPERTVHTVPLSLAIQLADLVERWQIPRDELLAGSGIAPSVMTDPLSRLPLVTMCDLIERARLLTAEPGIGYYLGLQKRVSIFGYLGFAALSARTIREALELGVEFAPTFSTALTIDLHVGVGEASLRLRENADLGPARDAVLISLMFGLQTIGSTLTGQEQKPSIDFAMPEPAYQPRFAHLAAGWRFGQPVTRLILDPAALDLPIVTADGAALQLARALCQQALEDLGFDTELVDRVRRLLKKEEGGFRSLEQVASSIHVSARTLKRRLAAQGASFAALADEQRREHALVLLHSSRLSIEDIAERLDYSNASTFVRAFHRWTGTTPASYRRTRLRQSVLDAE